MSDIEGFEQSSEYLNNIIQEAKKAGIDPQVHLKKRQHYEKLYIQLAQLQGIIINYDQLRNMKTIYLQRLVSAVSPKQKRKNIKEYPINIKS